MRRTLKLILIVLGIGAVAVLFQLVFGDSLIRRKCHNQLRSIGCVVQLYRETNDGSYPPNLEDIENGLLKSVLHCPGARKNKTDTGDNSDYIYVDWLKQSQDITKSLPAKYPLVYDARISNHKEKGINILLVDGSVIWDEKARWLTHFALDHKGIALPK